MSSIRDNQGYNQGFKLSEAVKIRLERRCDLIVSKINLKECKKILEIGCGTGEMSFLLAQKTNKNVIGIDKCPTFIEYASKTYKLPKLKYYCSIFEEYSKNNTDRYDAIVGNGILHHMYDNLKTSIKQIYEMLKINGRIAFFEPNINNPYCYLIFKYRIFRKLARLEPNEMAFSRSLIYKTLKDINFVNINIEYKDFLLPCTPGILIKPTIYASNVLENINNINSIAQSIFITAKKISA